MLYAWPTIEFPPEDLRALIERRYARATGGLGIEMVELRGAMRTEEVRERELRFLSPTGRGVVVEDDPPARSASPARRGRTADRAVAAARHGASR